MSIRSRLLVSIVALIGIIVISLSTMYLGSEIERSFDVARQIARINLGQVQSYIDNSARTQLAAVDPPPQTAAEITEAYREIVRQDLDLGRFLKQLTGNSPVIVEGRVTSPKGRILAASLDSTGRYHQSLPPFQQFQELSLWSKLAQTFYGDQEYEVTQDYGVVLADEQHWVLTIRMILSTVLLREKEVRPRVSRLAAASFFSLLISLLAAGIVSHVAVRPFVRISDLIDRISRGETAEEAGERAKEVAAVESKLTLLGKQFQGARDDVQQLRGNIDQLLARLEEAVLLFGRDDRLVMAGGAAERLLGVSRWELMGRSLAQVFSNKSEAGALLQSAVQFRRSFKDQIVTLPAADGRLQRLLVSLELVESPSQERLGALITLREADPRRQIESQLDISTRLAAISRLTSGAAHEIKNPLNSIALHVEVLRAKLLEVDVGADEIEVISREIQRLDRVVRSFLDFTRPVELSVAPVDLVQLLTDVAELVRPDAEEYDVDMRIRPGPPEALVRGDRDLLKQSLLNVVVNGVQAMADGGQLELWIEESGDDWTIGVRDEGAGIPPDLRDKIYQLYFTTKKEKGSGIGLAMTFQVVQLHGGTIDFASEVGKGTEFRIRLPAAAAEASDTEPWVETAKRLSS